MKKTIIIMTTLALVFGLVKVSPATSKKPDMCESVIQKVTFIHYAKPDNPGAKPAPEAALDKYKLLPRGIKWAGPVDYKFNNGVSGLNESEVINVLETSLATWDTETSFELFANNVETTGTLPGTYDQTNTIGWKELSAGIIAQNTIWYNRLDKEIIESDVAFNTLYDWSLSGEETMMDLQNIATHEFGHNGLADLYNPQTAELTMYGYSAEGEIIKRDLGPGDILGIQAVYGI